jgi:hypothetical protein
MTRNARTLNDDLLRRALMELAEGPDASALVSDVLRTVDSATQVRRRPWDISGSRRGGLLLVAAVLTAAIGGAVALSSPRPAPEPTPSPPPVPDAAIRVENFVQWFTYRVPPGQSVLLETPQAEYPAHTLTDGSRRLQLFSIWSQEVTDPVEVVQGLRDRMGSCITRIRPATLGNLPAMTAEFAPGPGRCSTLSFFAPGIGTNAITVSDPSRLLVAQTSHGTIGVLISAPTDEELAAWLPNAEAYVDSFEFTTGVNRFPD